MKAMKKIKKQGDEDRGKEENNKFLKQIQENIYKTVKGMDTVIQELNMVV